MFVHVDVNGDVDVNVDVDGDVDNQSVMLTAR